MNPLLNKNILSEIIEYLEVKSLVKLLILSKDIKNYVGKSNIWKKFTKINNTIDRPLGSLNLENYSEWYYILMAEHYSIHTNNELSRKPTKNSCYRETRCFISHAAGNIDKISFVHYFRRKKNSFYMSYTKFRDTRKEEEIIEKDNMFKTKTHDKNICLQHIFVYYVNDPKNVDSMICCGKDIISYEDVLYSVHDENHTPSLYTFTVYAPNTQC